MQGKAYATGGRATEQKKGRKPHRQRRIQDLRDAGAWEVNAVDADGEEWLGSRRLERLATKAGPWETDGIQQRR